MCEWFSLLPVAVDATFIGQWVKHWKTMRWILVFVQFWRVWCWKQLLVILPLWAATASLPLCLKPNTRSIHSCRCSDTYWLSSAVLCFWRKSLVSRVTNRIQEMWSSTQTDSNSNIKQHSEQQEVTWGPRWENDITNEASILPSAQIKTQFVFQKAGVTPIKLWNQLHYRRDIHTSQTTCLLHKDTLNTLLWQGESMCMFLWLKKSIVQADLSLHQLLNG